MGNHSERVLLDTAESYGIGAVARIAPKHRSKLGQYMTPAPIARFAASLFSDTSSDIKLLDPGAGVGSLTAAFIERVHSESLKDISSVSLICYEIEEALSDHLSDTLQSCSLQLKNSRIECNTKTYQKDFILSFTKSRLQRSLFSSSEEVESEFTHVIMNPPYKKIKSSSEHRLALRSTGIETSNLYTAFMMLAARKLQKGGEMVAIVPRSFCNGSYFRPFREQFFSLMQLQQVHLFEKRNSAFKNDDVLQENIILHAVRGGKNSTVSITTSKSGDFALDIESGGYVAEDMTCRVAGYDTVIKPDDPNLFVRLATSSFEQSIYDRIALFNLNLAELELEVSTGPVVDFRLKSDLRSQADENSVPLLYPAHFKSGELEWPKVTKKPNAIAVTEQSRRWLWLNEGHYLVLKRLTSKEESKRVVASVYDSSLPGELVGFENHLNVYHSSRKGFSRSVCFGLYVYLNSTLVDRYFRQFSGHTQVNATDLRSLSYPSIDILERMGKHAIEATKRVLTQSQIDEILENELAHMTDEINPLLAQQKIDQALQIIQALGMPKQQHNERSALTLLALLDLKPEDEWQNVKRPLIGITPVMSYCRDYYGKEYAPNTRETFRRQTMHQFVEAGIAVYNPDKPDRPVNSPKACYQISEETSIAIKAFGTDEWSNVLESYLKQKQTLADKWAKKREMNLVPVQVARNKEISLSPGAHSELIKQIIEEFAPRFAPNAEVIYVGDTGSKNEFFEEERLVSLGVTVDQHGKMPDVVLYLVEKDWLLLIESVTSHGPVDSKRHNELAELFSSAVPGIVYVTAFPSRSAMAKYLGVISWETEVWCAASPTHLIHFNGERFLGPYQK